MRRLSVLCLLVLSSIFALLRGAIRDPEEGNYTFFVTAGAVAWRRGGPVDG